MAIWIDENLCDNVKKDIRHLYPGKKVRSHCEPRTWQSSRYIQISTPIIDRYIHYELNLGKLQLHFEEKFISNDYKPLRKQIEECVQEDNDFIWRQRSGLRRGACEWNYSIENYDNLLEGISAMTQKFDPIINTYIEQHPEQFPNKAVKATIPSLTYTIPSSDSRNNVEPVVLCISKIPFDHLSIPPYQRPYKWTAKNVNQLISDIIMFRNKNQYRLGTLVLHKGEIVDGQQRIITLSLLLKIMFDSLKDDTLKQVYGSVIQKIDKFAQIAQFPNRYSLHNIIENIHTIEERKIDFNDDLFEFVLNKCEFVVIELNDISEAFQFFDSQNARGKDLAAHDLLKAYHLREIDELTTNDSNNIDIWQGLKTEFLVEVFLHLYRAKRWSQGKEARYFTKNRTGIFKGVSLREKKRYPFYQMEIIAHIFSEAYNSDPLRHIDNNHIEYPFNLDDQIVNGSRFFDMIRHYVDLYEQIQDISLFKANAKAYDILKCISKYEGMWRTGDQYVRSMFNTSLLYYIDRFGWEELDKVIPKIFIWAYTLRLESKAVQLASVDNYAREDHSIIRIIHSAKTPYDIINKSFEGAHYLACKKCEKIVEMFKSLNKFHENE